MPLDAFLSSYGSSERRLPGVAGNYAGRNLVICADAACVWEDLEAFGCRSDVKRGGVEKSGWQFMTINKLVEVFPGNIEHAYSNEPRLLNLFVEARRSEYRREFGPPKHTHAISAGAKWRWPFTGHGTSGLGAVLVGLGLGYDRIVLCGMPLDNSSHNGEPYWRKCAFETSEANSPRGRTGPNMHWQRAIESAFEGRVTSMSGRTREWLGSPSLS